MHTRTVTSIHDVEAAEWDSILERKHGYYTHRWGRYAEAVKSELNDPYYVLAYDAAERLVGRASFWVTREDEIPISLRPAQQALQWVLRHRPLLSCVSAESSHSGLIVTGDPALRQAAFEAIITSGEAIAKDHRCLAIVYNYLERDDDLDWPQGYDPADFGDNTIMDVTAYATHDEYLSSLKKKRRQDYKYTQRMAEEESFAVSYVTEVDVDAIVPLVKNNWEKYDLLTTHLVRRKIAESTMVDANWVLVHSDDGELIGCLSIIGEGPIRTLMNIGRKYNYDGMYFLLVDEAINYAIELGVEELRAGYKVYGPKYRRGFEPLPQRNIFKARVPGLGLLARHLE